VQSTLKIGTGKGKCDLLNNSKMERPHREIQFPLRASYWHLPVIPFHTALQKVKDWVVSLKEPVGISLQVFKSAYSYFKAEGMSRAKFKGKLPLE
jgi:hypothetical protein